MNRAAIKRQRALATKRVTPIAPRSISVETTGTSGASLVVATDGPRVVVTISTPGYDIGRSLTAVVTDKPALRKLAKLFTRAAR